MPDLMSALLPSVTNGMPAPREPRQQAGFTMPEMGVMPTRPVRPVFAQGPINALTGEQRDQRSTMEQDYRGEMNAYRAQMTDYALQALMSGPLFGGGFGRPRPQPGQPGLPGQGPPQGLPTQVPNNVAPQGMVGSSYGVQGMHPGASPFDLPTY